MDKKKYISPEMKITEFEAEDVITASPEDDELSIWTPNP